MAKSNADTYMSEAEVILRKYAGMNPNLAVWRCKQPMPFHPDLEIEMLLVGMPDEDKPSQPTSLIVFRTWVSSEAAEIDLCDMESSMTPFGGGHVPIKRLEELAKILPDL